MIRLGKRGLFAAIFMACAAALGAALYAQHTLGMQPCPWCVLQRVIFIVIGLCGLLGALWPGPMHRRLQGLLIFLLSGAGAAAALYQHFFAAQSKSCAQTLADRIIGQLQLDARWPDLFEVRASCFDAAVDLLGVPFEFWSLALFVVLGVAGLLALRRGR